MPRATLISVDEYLHTAYDPDCDYVDGVVENRNVGEYNHSRLQTEQVLTAPTLLCFEVISPEDRLHPMTTRAKEDSCHGLHEIRGRVLATADGRVRLDLDAIEQDFRA